MDRLGVLLANKARLMIKGCSQRPGFDYIDTYSLVVRIETVHAILAMVPKETIYMHQPEGYTDGTNRVGKLNKTLYGLKQSRHEWNNQLDLGLQDFEIITVWVNDLLLFATTDIEIQCMKKEITSKWRVTDLGEPSKIIGIKIMRSDDSISISQKQYIDSILRKQGLQHTNSVSTPMDHNHLPKPNPNHENTNQSNSYASLLGELQYLAVCTCPDIAYAVHKLASFMANPTLTYHITLKRILRYLAGTRDLRITYRKSEHAYDPLIGYADARFANTDDMKSTTGIVFKSLGGAILWKAKKQTLSALSTTEAEYVALSHAGTEAHWLRNLYDEIGLCLKRPLPIRCDNFGAISMANNLYISQSTRHINLKYHSIRRLIKQNYIITQLCRDAEQTADILTKALLRPKHKQHTMELGLAPI